MSVLRGAGSGREMSFWGHLLELRRRILVVVGFVAVFSVAGYLLFPYFFALVSEVIGEQLYATTIAEGFMTRLRIAVLLGMFLSLPVLLFQIMLFVFPALQRREKRFVLVLLVSTFLLFLGGVLYAYKSVLPVSVRFLKSGIFFPERVNRLISYRQFITFFFQFLLGFGVCFQFPVVLLALMKLGLFGVRALVRNFKYFVIGAFLFAAIITPPDMVSQILLALPMISLYALCILVGMLFRIGTR